MHKCTRIVADAAALEKMFQEEVAREGREGWQWERRQATKYFTAILLSWKIFLAVYCWFLFMVRVKKNPKEISDLVVQK